jgi:hypothetical protein
MLRLKAVLVRLEAGMPKWQETIALLVRLEATLRHMETENFDPPGTCCGCLQDVATTGHLARCPVARDLQAILDWKRSFGPDDVNWN